MRYLPTEDERRWLIDRLAGLLRNLGSEHFVSAAIVEPTPRFFPDRWSFSHEGLDRLVRRLMQYARLGDLDVEITTFVERLPWERTGHKRGGGIVAGSIKRADDRLEAEEAYYRGLDGASDKTQGSES